MNNNQPLNFCFFMKSPLNTHTHTYIC